MARLDSTTFGRHLHRARWAAARRLAGARKRLPAGARRVAVTFDDGPDPRFTPAVLEILDDLQMPATFFFVGANARLYPEIVRETRARGHAVGSHSEHHPDMRLLSVRDVIVEYGSGRKSIEVVTGAPAPLLRPPNGVILPSHCVGIRAFRFSTWLWSIDTRDWEADATIGTVMSHVGSPSDGDVILFHDGLRDPYGSKAGDRTVTLQALPRVVELLRREGLQPVLLR